MNPGRIILAVTPLLAAITCRGTTLTEDFASTPTANGWQIHGETNLFGWDSTNQNLRVTWDSAQTNSYFYHTLGTVVTSDDDFRLAFTLTLDDYASGTTPGKPYAAPVTIGCFNLDQATQASFFRGAGLNPTYGPRNLVEFNFFPEFDIFLPTIDQVMVSTNNGWLYNQDNLLPLTPGEAFEVTMLYEAGTRTLTTVITNDGVQYGQTQTITAPPNFDFRLTALSISSYSDGRDIGSVLAHGTVDNLTFTVPDPPIQVLSGGFNGSSWEVQFLGRSNWVYALERTADFVLWTNASATLVGAATPLSLVDTNPPAGGAFYRVRANRP